MQVYLTPAAKTALTHAVAGEYHHAMWDCVEVLVGEATAEQKEASRIALMRMPMVGAKVIRALIEFWAQPVRTSTWGGARKGFVVTWEKR